jgi:hypothetical protein
MYRAKSIDQCHQIYVRILYHRIKTVFLGGCGNLAVLVTIQVRPGGAVGESLANRWPSQAITSGATARGQHRSNLTAASPVYQT